MLQPIARRRCCDLPNFIANLSNFPAPGESFENLTLSTAY